MLQVLDAAALRAWCEAGCDALGAACAEIDGLNVFPVPDGDTGTNLLLTARAVLDEVRALDDPGAAAAVAAAMAHGALTGARGNSGVLLSQLLRGLADVLADGPADGAALARGLARGAELARAAVARPVEGTLLTVAAAAARTATAAAGTAGGPARADLAAVAAAALDGARVALAGTPAQLAALRAAGVVDAGGRGWVVLLEALEGVVCGRARPAAPPPLVDRAPGGVAAEREAGSAEHAYEVQYLLRGAGEEAAARLRDDLAALGDCVAVVGAAGLHNVHVHVDDVGAAIEAGLLAGRPYRIGVTRFADQQPPPAGRAVLAVAAGDGLVRLLRDAGAVVLDAAAGPPDAARLAAALRGAPAREVVVLPGDARLVGVARAAAALVPQVRVEVVATGSAAQALAALAVADPARALEDDVAAMAAAAAGTRTASLVRAAAAADTAAGPCLPGDLLGVLDGRVVAVGTDPGRVAERLLDVLLAAGPGAPELVSVLVGAGAPPGLGERLSASAVQRRPDVEVLVLDGGQPESLLLLAAE